MSEHPSGEGGIDRHIEFTEVETDPELVLRLAGVGTDLVILPIRRLDDGVGVYPEDALFLVKDLRSAGYEASFLDDAGQRVFEVKKSLLGLALGSIALGIAGNAGWDGLKWLLHKLSRSGEVPLQITQFDRDDDPSEPRTWEINGSPVRVLAALDNLQSDRAPGVAPSRSATQGEGDFSDDGPDDDLAAERSRREVETRLQNADAQLAASRELLASSVDREEAEIIARRSLASFASALNWAEGTDMEDDAHKRMDAAGKWVRSAFGCALTVDGFDYFEECPVALAHNRIGLSVGGVATRVCSICGRDLSECEHRRGRTYLVPGGSQALGWCRVCVARDGCEHRSHLQYRAPVVSIITEMAVHEVSIVGRPAHPDARIQRIGILTADLQRRFGDSFEPGMRVDCNKCLDECGGLVRHDDVLHG
ncbi:hypothetical protein ABTX24_21535 [Nocardioides sp. NPDC127514]|uniref:hypothetical protein n=1 Tax=unclassified Nocardioides TaxID=2615069 RepID=UPI0033236DA4